MDQELEKKYLQLFNTFHTDRMKFLSGKSMKCKDCENNKKFIIHNNQLIYNCGDQDNQCGDQFSITLPEYYHYDSKLKSLNEEIHGSFSYTDDIQDLSNYNLETLKNFLHIDTELNEQNEIINESNDTIVHIQKLYEEINQLQSIQQQIKDLHLLKQDIKIKKQKIMKQIKNETDVSQLRKLRKEYATIFIQEKKEVIPLFESLNQKNKEYICIQDPIINELHNTYKGKEIKKKTKKTTQLIDIILEHFKTHDGILTEIDYIKLSKENNFKTGWENLLFLSLQEPSETFKRPWKLKQQEKYGSIIKKPPQEPEFIELTDTWKDLLFKKDKIDMEQLNINLKDILGDPRGYEMCKKLAENKISKENIQKYRKKIHKKILKKIDGEITIDNFKTKITIDTMKYMFELYDKYFFNNELAKFGKELGCMWTICWNNRCTNAAGRQRCTVEDKCKRIEIELSSKVFDKAIRKLMKSDDVFIRLDKENNCDSVLSCFTFTFEHELVHSLLACFCPQWNDTNKGAGNWTGKTKVAGHHTKTFMSILNNTFGHVNFIHGLFLNNDEFSKMFEDKKEKKVLKKKTKKILKKKVEEPVEEIIESEEITDEPIKRKGIGDELEDLQVELIKEVSKSEQKLKSN